jgi:hypothetical protein
MGREKNGFRTMTRTLFAALALIVFAAASSAVSQAQVAPPQSSSGVAPGTLISAELSKPVDGKKAKVGEKVEAKVVEDVVSNGQVVVPKGSKMIGHVADAKAKNRDSKGSAVGIVFDTLSMKGREVTIQASIQAIGAPQTPVNYSNRTGFPIGAQTGPPPTGGWGQPQDRPGPVLDPATHGVMGMDGVSLSRSGPASVVSATDQNIHLDTGTQLILRIEESL